MNNELLNQYNKELELLSSQPDSQEYKDVKQLIAKIDKADLSSLEEKFETILANDQTADFRVTLWKKPNSEEIRVYLNVFNARGYKYPLNNNYVVL